MNNLTQVPVNILGRSFAINVPREEQGTLQYAVNLLNQKIETIQSQGKIIDNETLIIVAALNLSHDFLQMRSKDGLDFIQFEGRIKEMLDICREVK